MKQTPNTDICIIGAGSGGLSLAAGAAQLGAKVVLIEEGKMGGECLNNGCIPSKSLLASAKVAKLIRNSLSFGINSQTPEINYAKVHDNVQKIKSTIAPHDSTERFSGLGVTVIAGKAQFVDPETVKVNGQLIKARRFVIATGSSPATPSIPGLSTVAFLTNETIFDLQEKPSRLIIIGGGPIGCELAQAFLLLGTSVTLLEAQTILPKDDADLANIVRQELIKDGLDLYENVKINNITKSDANVTVIFASNGTPRTIDGSHILIATGRKPHLSDLNLEAANVTYNVHGVTVNNRLQTSNKKIYAIGDIAGEFHFTHIANYHAGIVLRNILFRCPSKVNYDALPWVTFTDPELAQVGLTEAEAKKDGKKVRIIEADFSENDRAQAEHQTVGKIKVILSKFGKILGVSIVGPHAGELILPWGIAINEKLSMKSMASIIVAYPTLSEINKAAAINFYKPKLFSGIMRFVVKLLSKFG
jgi:pyruvate/2-oxoglutarate dehydrogenase complex dihydrolipoamide dehydrogenase (E3) component